MIVVSSATTGRPAARAARTSSAMASGGVTRVPAQAVRPSEVKDSPVARPRLSPRRSSWSSDQRGIRLVLGVADGVGFGLEEGAQQLGGRAQAVVAGGVGGPESFARQRHQPEGEPLVGR